MFYISLTGLLVGLLVACAHGFDNFEAPETAAEAIDLSNDHHTILILGTTTYKIADMIE